jgi:hypothetical protein
MRNSYSSVDLTHHNSYSTPEAIPYSASACCFVELALVIAILEGSRVKFLQCCHILQLLYILDLVGTLYIESMKQGVSTTATIHGRKYETVKRSPSSIVHNPRANPWVRIIVLIEVPESSSSSKTR